MNRKTQTKKEAFAFTKKKKKSSIKSMFFIFSLWFLLPLKTKRVVFFYANEIKDQAYHVYEDKQKYYERCEAFKRIR